jgi:hypothetical protein
MKKNKFLALAVLAVASAQPVLGCDLCAIYSAQEAQGGGKGFFAGTAEQFTDFSSFKSDGHSAPNTDSAFIHSLSSQIFAGYNFNQRAGVQFNLPVIYREYGQVAAHGSELGLGDASLVGNFRLYQKTTDDFSFTWTALGGIKFPTGDSSWLGRPDFAAGIGGHDLALGSGSVDGLLGTGFSARWKRLFFTGQMQYAVRTEGDFQHQYANDWTWAGGPGVYLALQDDYTIALQGTVSGESKGKDTFGGVPDDDSAETIVYIGPQISFTWSDNFSAHIGADLPVSYDNSGDQIMPSCRIRGAVTWRF